jgi:hypothetical protein
MEVEGKTALASVRGQEYSLFPLLGSTKKENQLH